MKRRYKILEGSGMEELEVLLDEAYDEHGNLEVHGFYHFKGYFVALVSYNA